MRGTTKELKSIVNARTGSFMNQSTDETGDEQPPAHRLSLGLSSSGATNIPLSGDMNARLRKLQELSNTDKDVIEALQKKLASQRIDFDNLQ